ncbi:DELLA protein RGL1-like [Juglans microcarpa x Juglans regia]|uniref:DELLA protein RGL1-like n=1 Tax=Juglans microcarpa x Juglans regia TaxID=2249226 RepID=UPI001B7EEB69|nr:DELLA protein RGL1-like [Juglans microcarpa x Juglans regia]
MANYTLFSFKPFDFDGIQGNYESFEDLEKEETLALDEYQFNHVYSPTPQLILEISKLACIQITRYPGILEHDKQIPHLPLLPFLRNDGSGTLRNINAETCGVSRKLSIEEIVRVAGARLLLHCEWISSAGCNSVQRVVFHFALALRERIAKESRRSVKTGNGGFKQNDLIDEELGSNPSLLAFYRQLPFVQITLFAGIQVISESVASERKALVDGKGFPVELLKITAVESIGNERIEETDKRLESVAQSMNLPCSFKSIILSDMKDIKEEFFEIEDDEMVIIFAPLVLRTMISRPSCLENFMRVITNLNPSIMIVIEVETNHNSASFVNRFIESLFFYCAYFDSLETCMEQHGEERMKMETIMGGHIRNLVAEEGRRRKNRSVTMDVWRAFFARFRMVEIGFSQSSLNQASLVAEWFSCKNYCTLDKNGKCLIVGWK